MLHVALILGTLASEIAGDSEHVGEGGELPLPALAFGLIAFALLMGLLALTFAFRSVGKRH